MRKTLLSMILLFTASAAFAQKQSMSAFIDALMQKMTLQEKIGQLNLQVAGDITTGSAQNSPVAERIMKGDLGGVFNIKGAEKIKALQEIAVKKSRLGIPLIVGLDVIHGYETVFPIPLAQSCSWDMEAIKQGAHIAAKEASADGICWTFSPMVDICVDARWGRIAEGSGEDPYLGSMIAKAMVEGYQGDYSQTDNIMACVKHYALYGAVEAGRDYNTVDMSHLRMYNQYFPPYRAAAEAGAGSFMSSFNIVDGVPATANKWLLTDVLRRQWKSDAFVVTDYGSIGEMVVHGVGDIASSSAQALKAGTDMDMCSEGFLKTLDGSVKSGNVSMADIDTACRRVLEAKYKLGLFQNPYKYCDKKRRAKDVLTKENRIAARNMAAETFVLLKNDNHLLPLKREGKIALIGPLANNRANMEGTWSVAAVPDQYSTLKEAFEKAVAGKAEILYSHGCNLTADSNLQKAAYFDKPLPRVDDAKMKAETMEMAAKADVIVCAMGECSDMTGESSSRINIEMPDVQHELLMQLASLGKPIVLLNFSGRPTILNWEKAHIPAILNVWFGGSEAADAICDVVFGEKVPSGKLTTSMPQSVGQEPLYYNHLNTGRPVAEGATNYWKYHSNYLDVRNDPLYPFGYGLSYTTFKYGKVKIDSDKMSKDGNVNISVTVTNTGDYDADEVVQLYIRDLVASVCRPVKELKGFQRIHLAKSESKEVTFHVTSEQLKFYNANLDYVVEPGDFELMVGPNSRDVQTVKLTVN